jgi:phosphinothricin acetyltransferase
MSPLVIRPALPADLPALLSLYNHYVVHTPITFDIEPLTLTQRAPWLAQFATTGRQRLLVAERDGALLGYAGTHSFRPKQAYETTAETTIYLAPHAHGTGVGSALYAALFAALAAEDIRVFMAGITLPNAASIALHAKFGFTLAGVMHAVGRKFDKYWDVGWYERVLPEPSADGAQPARDQ